MMQVLLSTYDGCSDLWPIMELALKKYWPTDKLDIYITNEIKVPPPLFKPLNLGAGLNWTQLNRKAFDLLPYPNTLLLVEDCFPRGPIDIPTLKYSLDIMNTHNIKYLRLVPRNTTFGSDINPLISYISPNYPYLISLNAAIWDNSFFKSLLHQEGTESIHQFEVNASIRVKPFVGSLASYRFDVGTYGHHSVMAGKWFPSMYKAIAAEYNLPNKPERKLLNSFQLFNWRLRKLRQFIKYGPQIR